MKHTVKIGLIVFGFIIVSFIGFAIISSLFGANTMSLSVPPYEGSSGMSMPGTPPIGSFDTRDKAISYDVTQSIIAPEPGGQIPPTDTKDRLVVSNGSIALVVTQIVSSVDQIKKIAEANQGYVVSSSISDSLYTIQPMQEQAVRETAKTPTHGTITIRVASDQLTSVMSQIRALGSKVTSESTNSDDVTDQFVDLEARLRNLQTKATQLQKILSSATSVTDTLAVYSQVSQTQGEIEQLQGQITYLKQSAKLSLITVSLSVEEEAIANVNVTKWRPLVVAEEAFYSLLNFFKGLSYFVIWIAIFAPLWLPIIAIAWYVRKRRAKQPTPSQST